jgi:hypothetical protein
VPKNGAATPCNLLAGTALDAAFRIIMLRILHAAAFCIFECFVKNLQISLWTRHLKGPSFPEESL